MQQRWHCIDGGLVHSKPVVLEVEVEMVANAGRGHNKVHLNVGSVAELGTLLQTQDRYTR